MHIELRQLRYLVALADERHFTRAAAREYVAQPALSQQIQRLEQQVGLPLVDRTTRRVRLTDAGEALVARARRILAEVDAAQQELEARAGVRAGRVVIGAMQSLGPFDLPALLREFHRRYPDVDLTVREEVSEPLVAMVADDTVDMAFLSLAEAARHGQLATEPLITEPIVALLPNEHRLARRKRLKLHELRDEPFVTFREGAGIRRILMHAAAAEGFEPQIAFETNNVQRIRELVSIGLGVAVVPQSDGVEPGPPVAASLISPPMTRDVTLAWRQTRRLSPAALAFLELARLGGRRRTRPER